MDGGDEGRIHRFGPFELDARAFELRRDGRPVKVEPQSLSILLLLAENEGRLVTRDDLIAGIWRREAVSDWAISTAIRGARAALGESGAERRFIQTVHGRGYRFTGDGAEGAVLLVEPFEALGPEAADAYLAAGLADDLITDLARMEGFAVLSRGAAQAAGAAGARAVGASHVLGGGLRRSGDRLRVNARLSEAGTGRAVWAERFEGREDEIFAMQDRMAAAVAHALAPGAASGPTRPARDPAAYDAYLKGRFEYYMYSPAHLAKALGHFERATEIDPGFAEAFAHQAYCRNTLHVFGWPGADETLAPVLALADMAVALDPDGALGHARRGWTLGYLGRPEETVAAFERAAALAPESGEVHYAWGETMNRLGDPARALALLDRAFSLEAFFPPTWEFAKGHSRALLRETEAAAAHFEAVLERAPGFVPARVQYARTLAEAGRAADAAAMVAALGKFAPACSLTAAARMFPYPQPAEAERLRAALAAAGLD